MALLPPWWPEIELKKYILLISRVAAKLAAGPPLYWWSPPVYWRFKLSSNWPETHILLNKSIKEVLIHCLI